MSRGTGSQGYCEVIAVRHGLTDYNEQRRLQGQLDVRLNDRGREQCRACGKMLKHMFAGEDGQTIAIDAIYASPLDRTRESAEIIRAVAGIQCEVILDGRIKEWNAGVLQGHLLDELSVVFPKEWEAWNRSRDPNFVFPGGESFQHRYDRVKSFFLDVSLRHLGQRIFVVTHGGVLDDLFRLVRNVPMNVRTNVPKVNAEVYIVRAHTTATALEPNTPEETSNDCVSRASTESTNADNCTQKSYISWEIVSWGRVQKRDPLLTVEFENTPVDVSVRNIEYA